MEEPYEDDQSIADDEQLYRRIPEWHWDGCPGDSCRPSSAAFYDDPDGQPMSVDIASLSTPESVLEGHDRFALVAFTAQLARSSQLIVVPLPLDSNPAHAVVPGNKTQGVRRTLAKQCTWIVSPDQVVEPPQQVDPPVQIDPPQQEDPPVQVDPPE